MKMTKRVLSILVACVMLLGVMPLAVSAEGTQDAPINANDKWFGWGVDCFLINTTLETGDADGVWYELTADAAGILQLEHSYNDVDYQITVNVNGREYLGYEDGIYNMPIATLPVAVGDVISIHIIAQDTTLGGTVYCNAKFLTGEAGAQNAIKLKNANIKVWVAAGQTVYFQDDSLQAEYAAMGMNLLGNVEDVTFYNVTYTSSSAASKTAFTDADGDGIIELKLGGSAGSAGAPAVKPAFAIENASAEDRCFVLSVVENTAHECVYDDDADADCNTCGEIREVETPCPHDYDNDCDADCNTCGEPREVGEHVYENVFDAYCDICGDGQRVTPGIAFYGASISEDVNGLAMTFDAAVEGMEADGYEAIYDNATIGGYKLISMGAVAWNDGAKKHGVEDADGNRVLDVPAVYLWDINEETGTVSYAIRIINIPDEYKDRVINFRSYFIYEDKEGKQHTVYGDTAAGAYNQF